MLPPNKAYPKGEPYIAARYVDYAKCWGCKRPTTMTVAEFNGLPTLGRDDFATLGKKYGGNLAELPTKDLLGAGFTKGQAEDLFGAGYVDPSELALLAPESTEAP